MDSLLLSYHELFHIETSRREINRSALPLSYKVAFESLESDHKDLWSLEHLNLLNSLFVGLALVTVPFVLAAQFFGTIKQSEAVSYGNLVRVVLFTLW